MTHVQMENTATWVDQRYGSLLARLSRETLEASAIEVGDLIDTKGRMADRIELFRGYAGWLAETPLKKVGYGVSKPGTRLWQMDCNPDKTVTCIYISSVDFNRHGRLVRGKTDSRAVITHHAMGRLFERLRTNALGEVIRIGLVPLTELLPPKRLGEEATIRIPEVGRFEAVADMDEGKPEEMIWIIKTFIDE